MLFHFVDGVQNHANRDGDAARGASGVAAELHLPELDEERFEVAVAAVEVDLGDAQKIAGSEKRPELIAKLATGSCEAWRFKPVAADGDVLDGGYDIFVNLISKFGW